MSQPIRILIVEDSEDDARLAVWELHRAGFAPSCRRVQSEAELRAALAEQPWDAVLSVFSLPGFTGLDALAIVRAAALDIPFILLSGAIGEETAAAAMKAGANDYVMKGHLARLVPALQRELREAEARCVHREGQAALAASERRYRLLFHGSTLPLWVYDIETLRFLDVNDVACLVYGYSREEFLALTLRDIRPAEDVPMLEREAAADRVPPSKPRIWRHRLKNGALIDVEVRSHTIAYLGRTARFVSAIDVTDRLRAEKHVRRLSLAVQQSPSPTLITDTEGRIKYANPKFVEISGYPIEELIGRTPAVVKSGLTPPGVYADLWATIKAGRTWRGVLRNRRKSGELYWEDTTISPLLDESGEIVNFIAVKEDITRRREAEEEVRRLNEELEERVRERTRELEAANREMEAFSYSVSHDLRAPVVAVKQFAAALREAAGERMDEDATRHLERIQGSAQRMEQVIEELLSLSHISRARLVGSEVDLTSLANEVLAEIRAVDPQRKCELAVAPSMRAHGDPNLLRIALTNLVANSWKFSGKREVVSIQIGRAANGSDPTFYVRDRGAGFDPAFAGKLFGTFQRLHSTSEFPGTGIGLAIVRRVMERHGGSVRGEGAVNAGATFWFTLPRRSADA